VNSRRLRHVFAPIALAALAVGAAACGDDDKGDGEGAAEEVGVVAVVDVWVREPAAGAERTAAYGIVNNGTADDVTLVGVESPVGSSTELHETLVDDEGTMSMQEKEDGFTIDPGGALVLEPGGANVMIFGVTVEELAEPFELTFVFDGADDVTASADVVAIGEGGMDEMDEMDEMDDMDTDG
jgi:copper(I)-binding protein